MNRKGHGFFWRSIAAGLLTGLAAAAASEARAQSAEPGMQAAAKAVVRSCDTNPAEPVDGLWRAPAGVRGAAGDTRLVVVTQQHIGVYLKANCSEVSREPLADFFAAFVAADDTRIGFSPQALYDPASKRFMVATPASGASAFSTHLYFAVSTDDLASAWRLYRFVFEDEDGIDRLCRSNPAMFISSVMAGRNADRWLFAVNGSTDTAFVSAVLSIDKAPTLTGAAATAKCFTNLAAGLVPPVVEGEAEKAFFLATGFQSGNRIRRYVLSTKGRKPRSDTLAATAPIVIPRWDAPPDAPQPNDVLVDTLDGRFVAPTAQIGKALWNVHTVKVGDFARWRLYKFSTTTTAPLFTLTPSNTAGEFLFSASVAASAQEAFVTYSRTHPDEPTEGHPAMLIAHGPNGDAAGWIFDRIATSGGDVFDDCSFVTDVCFWGGSTTQIDPTNPNHAWGFAQLNGGSSSFNWRTRAGRVR